jgi:competence protein ComEC
VELGQKNMQILLQRFLSNIYIALPHTEAALLAGILFGDKTGFSKDFYSALKNIGIVHIVVVSGTNVMIVAGLLIEGLSYLIGRKRSIVIGLPIIWMYGIIVGLQAPILRAVLLISLLYLAQLLGRKFDIWRAFALVFLIVIFSDKTMYMNIGFWLSFVAFGAVVLDPKWVWLWITPLLALFFGKISLVAPLTNATVLFLIEIVTIVGGIGVILNIKYILWLIMPILKYITWLTNTLGELKWVSTEIKFNWLMLIGSYLLLIWFYLKRNEKQKIVGN